MAAQWKVAAYASGAGGAGGSAGGSAGGDAGGGAGGDAVVVMQGTDGEVPGLKVSLQDRGSLSVVACDENVFRVSYLIDAEARRVRPSWFVADPANPQAIRPEGLERDELPARIRAGVEAQLQAGHEMRPACSAAAQASGRLQLQVDAAAATLTTGLGAKVQINADTPNRPPAITLTLNGHLMHQDFVPGAYRHDAAPQAAQTPRAAGAVSHLTQILPGDHLYGLGDASGTLERSGQRFRLHAVDGMGYEADPTTGRRSDPLYKHFPLLYCLRVDPATDAVLGAYGILYDNGCRGFVDTGAEISAFRGSYRHAQFDGGDLEYYLVVGATLRDVVRRMAALIGLPAPSPRWMFGYLGSTMAYTESPNAQERLKQFARDCDHHDILCDGFHLSSGYTCVDTPEGGFGARCVFTWNQRRVSDPAALFADFNARDIHVLPNIKPWLLQADHPEYAQVAASGGMVRTSDGQAPLEGVFWSGGEGSFAVGSYVDFASPTGFAWWVRSAQEQLLQHGATGLWNDNNEYEVDDDLALCGSGLPGSEGNACHPLLYMRPVQGILMAMASYSALAETYPDRLPVIVSRSGSPGAQRFCVQTWTGDNRTSWRTLRWNTPMGLNLGLCGWPCNGHDIGGFKGPMPGPELLVRWVQSGIFQPRFCIHSWNDNQTCTELWSYPEHVDTLRRCLQLRYRLLPYLHSLGVEAQQFGDPIARPIVLEYSADPHFRGQVQPHDDADGDGGAATPNSDPSDLDLSFGASCDWLLGSALLVAPITRQGAMERRVRLPGALAGGVVDGTTWFDWRTGKVHQGGSIVLLKGGLDASSCPLLVRGDQGVPLLARLPACSATGLATLPEDGGRVVLLPLAGPAGRPCQATWYEREPDSRQAGIARVDLRAEAVAGSDLTFTIAVTTAISQAAGYTLPYKALTVLVPKTQCQQLQAADGTPLPVATDVPSLYELGLDPEAYAAFTLPL